MGDSLKKLKLIVPAAAVAAIVAVTAMVSTSGAAPRHKAGAAAKATVIGVKKVSGLGSVLDAGPKKLTVYIYTKDHGSKPSCTGACAKAWPPVTTKGEPKAGPGAKSSDLGTTKASSGAEQVTYKGHPLYYFKSDKSSKSVSGQALEGLWWVLSPSGAEIKKKPMSEEKAAPEGPEGGEEEAPETEEPAMEEPAMEEPAMEEAPAGGGGGWG